MRTMVFDTETTGLPVHGGELKVQPFIIEIGAAIYEEGKLVREYSQLINPGIPISAEITKITGIQDADVADKLAFKNYWDAEFRDMLESCDVLIAHNAEFDTRLLRFEFERLGKTPDEAKLMLPQTVLCTVAEFWHLFGRRAKLTELYLYLIGKPLEQTHRALDDVKALAACCQKGGLI